MHTGPAAAPAGREAERLIREAMFLLVLEIRLTGLA